MYHCGMRALLGEGIKWGVKAGETALLFPVLWATRAHKTARQLGAWLPSASGLKARMRREGACGSVFFKYT